MDFNLPKLYKDYGDYSNYRNFPYSIDGLKPVERRVLLSAYKIARAKFAKCRQVDTYTCGHYHPHGECYGTIVQLVKQGFLEGQGNFGTNVGVELVGAAAPRYTECKIYQRTIDLAFKYVNYIPWINTELDDKEPIHLPTMFPVCLMGTEYTQGIGFGFKTYIPCYKVTDLYQRLLWLLGKRKRKPTIAPITDCQITSSKEDLEQLLTTGKAKIAIEGIIIENNIKNTVILKSWPPGKRFESFLNKFSKELDSGLIGFADLSVTETEISFQVLRERNRDKIFKAFVKKLKKAIKGFISFEIMLVDENQKVTLKPIDDMLMETYNMFQEVNETMLTQEIINMGDTISEYKTLELIKKPLIYGISKGWSISLTIESIERETFIPAETIKMLISKYRISKLLTLNTETTELENKKNEFEKNLENLTEFVLEQYNGF